MKRQGDKPTGFRRHLEGWQAALVSLCMAGAAVLLGMPRAAPPSGLPDPLVDKSRIDDMVRIENERAQRVRELPLPFEVRAVGEAFRAYGADASSSELDWQGHGTELGKRARAALELHGPEPLLDLRALQTEFFLQALGRWEATGEQHSELTELGGDFVDKASTNGWLDAAGSLSLDALERRILFRLRWTALTDLLDVHPFRPGLDEWRAYYGFLMRHPESGRDARLLDRAAKQLAYVTALGKRDPDYPADFARGVLLSESGQHQLSMQAFQRHLARRPHGPWTLRARNFWLNAAKLSGAPH